MNTLPETAVLPAGWKLPPELVADAPPEMRAMARDDVRLMVSGSDQVSVVHARFWEIGNFLRPGDLLVINTTATRPAALSSRYDQTPVVVHFATPLGGADWVVEVRTAQGGGKTGAFFAAAAGKNLRLAGGARLTLTTPRAVGPKPGTVRLWQARLFLPSEFSDSHDFFAQYGEPIRYNYVRAPWALPYYQTVYAVEPGSAEMPSAGRAFTPELITRLVARGVSFAPIVLHTGVSSPEMHEPPQPEFYRVPPNSAHAVNSTRQNGGRVIAVGTTVIRALETVSDPNGIVYSGEGWTDLVITPARGVRTVNGLLTGLHEPEASHLWMLEALTEKSTIEKAYAEALRRDYLWHEFGDLHLILSFLR